MTSPAIPARRHHWLRAVGYGLLAEIATIATIIAVVMIYRYILAKGLTESSYAAFSESVGAIIGIVGGTLYTFLFARLLMRKLGSDFIAHGIVVGLGAVALSVAGSLAGHRGLPAAYLLASVLKIAAGALAGFLRARSAPVG